MKATSADQIEPIGQSVLANRTRQRLFRDRNMRGLSTAQVVHDLYAGDKEFSDDIEAISYMNLKNYIGNHHVYREDQFGMRFSVETRFPFLDHNLVESAFRIPSTYKVRGNIQKYVLRKAAEGFIHDSCFKAPKRGFSVPLGVWMHGPLKEFVKARLRRLADRPMFNSDEIFRRYAEWEEGRQGFLSVWILVAVEMWLCLFIDGVPQGNGGFLDEIPIIPFEEGRTDLTAE